MADDGGHRNFEVHDRMECHHGQHKTMYQRRKEITARLLSHNVKYVNFKL